jgi:hypothetical protein
MAKKATKTKKRAHEPHVAQATLAKLSAWSDAISPRQWLTMIGLVALVLGARWGLKRMEDHVQRLPQCNPAPRLELVDLPDWAVTEGWAPRFASAVELDETTEWRDESLPRRIAEAFAQCGWVKSVRRVAKAPDGSIRVSCEFRRPIGMVQTARGFIPVDAEGIRLPEVYDRLSPGWIMIRGVESPPPAVGEAWSAADLAAGTKLTKMLSDQPWGNRVTVIDVSNFRGRHDRRRHHIEFTTDTGMRIRWGSAPGEEIEEPTPAEKLRNIGEKLQTRPNRAWIDVSVFEDRVLVPAEGATGVQMAGAPERAG